MKYYISKGIDYEVTENNFKLTRKEYKLIRSRGYLYDKQKTGMHIPLPSSAFEDMKNEIIFLRKERLSKRIDKLLVT